jgi:hypothetical protein
VAEGVCHGEEGGCRAAPCHHVIDGARGHAELAQDALSDHHHEDGQNEEAGEGAGGVVQQVERPPPHRGLQLAVDVDHGLAFGAGLLSKKPEE